MSAFRLLGQNGSEVDVDWSNPAVEGVVVLMRDPDSTLGAAVAIKDPAAMDPDEVADLLEDLAHVVARPAPTPLVKDMKPRHD